MIPRRDGGFVTVEHVVIAALGLVLFTWAVNVVLLQYARSVTRLALDEGVRAGAVAADPAGGCDAAARDAMADLADGPLGSGIVIACTVDATHVRATATGSVTSWVPGVPQWGIEAGAAATRGSAP